MFYQTTSKSGMPMTQLLMEENIKSYFFIAMLLMASRTFAQNPYQYYDGRYDGCPPASEDGGYCQTMRDANRMIEEGNRSVEDLNKRKASCDNAAPICDNGDMEACTYLRTYCAGVFRGFSKYK